MTAKNDNPSSPEASRPLTASHGFCVQRLVRRIRWVINRLQITIPVNRKRALALGFFVFDGPREWGLGCIYFDGPNYYLAAGNLGFGWGMHARMERALPNDKEEPMRASDSRARTAPAKTL